MKPTFALSMVLGLTLLACPLTSLPAVSPVSSPTPDTGVLSDPATGLDKLEHYRNTLTISFQGEKDGQASKTTSVIDHVVWHESATTFTTIDDQDGTGQLRHLLTGSVKNVAYSRMPDSENCKATWGAVSADNVDIDPANLLPTLLSGDNQGEISLDGIATNHYHLDSNSLGLSEGKAVGDAWIAKEGGYVVKYQLEIQNGSATPGQGFNGTWIYNYAISEVNDGSTVVYPEGCEPVLTEVPVLPDASDEDHLSGVLYFTTTSTQEQVGDFYNKFFTQNGWTVISKPSQDDTYALWVFRRADSDAFATIARDQDKGFAWVTVHLTGTLNPLAAAGSTVEPGGPTTTPAQNPQAQVQDSLTLLVGSQDSPSVLPSFTFTVDLALPEGLPQQSENLAGEAEAGAFHFSGSYAGMQLEAWLTTDGQFLDMSGSTDSGMGQMAWLNWQTIAISAIQTAAKTASNSGGETVNSRQAEVFVVTETGSGNSASGAVTFSDLQGKIWVDRSTGALLKTDLTFQVASTLPGMSNVQGKGSLAIQVDQVGQAKVTLPK